MAGTQLAPTTAPEGQEIATFAGVFRTVYRQSCYTQPSLADCTAHRMAIVSLCGQRVTNGHLPALVAGVGGLGARHSHHLPLRIAGGCFWGLELAYQRMPGVSHTSVGYTAGNTKNPTYQQVCSGRTGHAEAVQVRFSLFEGVMVIKRWQTVSSWQVRCGVLSPQLRASPFFLQFFVHWGDSARHEL